MLRDIDSLPAAVSVRNGQTAWPRSPCAACQSSPSNLCRALCRGGADGAVVKASRPVAARQHIYRACETAEGVLAICRGWAVRFVQLANGKRQILSLLLPGDVVGASILEARFDFSIQAVTDARICVFPRTEVHVRIANAAALFEAWLSAIAAASRDAERRLVDLGQRMAQERIAALVAHVMLRCEQRGELLGGEFPFPLSQQQIADCTGLTPVHTCRVLSALRRSGVCEVGCGAVNVVDRSALTHIAAPR